jgi:hypothetical protein
MSETVSSIEQFINLGYAASDFHWLASYFDVATIIVADPFSPRRTQDELFIRKARWSTIDTLIASENKESIDEFINKGRVGITYNTDT